RRDSRHERRVATRRSDERGGVRARRDDACGGRRTHVRARVQRAAHADRCGDRTAREHAAGEAPGARWVRCPASGARPLFTLMRTVLVFLTLITMTPFFGLMVIIASLVVVKDAEGSIYHNAPRWWARGLLSA